MALLIFLLLVIPTMRSTRPTTANKPPSASITHTYHGCSLRLRLFCSYRTKPITTMIMPSISSTRPEIVSGPNPILYPLQLWAILEYCFEYFHSHTGDVHLPFFPCIPLGSPFLPRISRILPLIDGVSVGSSPMCHSATNWTNC